MATRGPNPASLCLLSDLPLKEVGDKVRFLGCVVSYSTVTARLGLRHLEPPGNIVTAFVDVELVLELIKPEMTRVGEWVNIMGYVTAKPSVTKGQDADNVEKASVYVQAIWIRSTGPLDLQTYEGLFKPNMLWKSGSDG